MTQPWQCPNCGKRADYEVVFNPATGKYVCRKCGAEVLQKQPDGGFKGQ
ncbi:MAG: TFIIB-type zinc ribbon-containing protein [Candidatus Nomurabacteria bacterium]|nr:TFIIB-type zinc ribbon-containing protein [Candidatus Nomurabacteria bacterium]